MQWLILMLILTYCETISTNLKLALCLEASGIWFSG